MTSPLDTRESWLLACIKLLKPDFQAVGANVPEKLRASCGWPSKSGLAKKKRRIGEAWSAKCSGDETFEVFISPVLKDGRPVLATLVHEIVHCAVGVEEGHKGPFKKIALAIGLEGKMTETTAGETLLKRLDEIIAEVGPYPHAELTSSNAPKKQTCRQLKVICKECGCICRMSRKAIDEVGCPTCACGGVMEEEESDGDDEEDGGAIVDFKDGHRVVKLAEQWDRYTGVNQYCVVGLNERDSDANGIIRHVSQYCDLHEPYKDQFRIAP